MTTKQSAPADRMPLTRRRVLEAALQFVDTHGLEALSMHKLGAELGVKAMSLYNHVANKDEILDGIVELLWEHIEKAAPARENWCDGARSYAYGLRDAIRRHPNAAPLLTSRHLMPAPALRLIQDHVSAAERAGTDEDRAYALLRTITSYALGSTLAEVSWGFGRPGCTPTVNDLLRPGTSDELAGVAEIFCGQSDPDAQFELGLDLMLRGVQATCTPDPRDNP